MEQAKRGKKKRRNAARHVEEEVKQYLEAVKMKEKYRRERDRQHNTVCEPNDEGEVECYVKKSAPAYRSQHHQRCQCPKCRFKTPQRIEDQPHHIEDRIWEDEFLEEREPPGIFSDMFSWLLGAEDMEEGDDISSPSYEEVVDWIEYDDSQTDLLIMPDLLIKPDLLVVYFCILVLVIFICYYCCRRRRSYCGNVEVIGNYETAEEGEPPAAIKPAPSTAIKPAPSTVVKPAPPAAIKPAPSTVDKPAPPAVIKPAPPAAIIPAPPAVVKPKPVKDEGELSGDEYTNETQETEL